MTRPVNAILHAERAKDRFYDMVLAALERAHREQGLTRKDIAEKIGRSPPQISKWLSGPSNWTIDTVSDLLFAIDADVEPDMKYFKDNIKNNKFTSLDATPPARVSVDGSGQTSFSSTNNIVINVTGEPRNG